MVITIRRAGFPPVVIFVFFNRDIDHKNSYNYSYSYSSYTIKSESESKKSTTTCYNSTIGSTKKELTSTTDQQPTDNQQLTSCRNDKKQDNQLQRQKQHNQLQRQKQYNQLKDKNIIDYTNDLQ